MWARCWGLISIVGGFAACKKADDFPIINNDVDAGTKHIDAAIDAPPDASLDAPAMITGKVCLLDDLRNESTCDPGGTGIVNVTVGGTTVQTDPSGTFSMPPPAQSLVWHVSGAGIVTTAMAVDLGTTIPVMATVTYDALAQGNSEAIDPTQGSLVVRCRRQGAAAMKAVVSVTPGAPVLYDTTSATTWGTVSTGPLGLAWLANLPVGSADVTATPFTGAPSMGTFTVETATITFVDMSI